MRDVRVYITLSVRAEQLPTETLLQCVSTLSPLCFYCFYLSGAFLHCHYHCVIVFSTKKKTDLLTDEVYLHAE